MDGPNNKVLRLFHGGKMDGESHWVDKDCHIYLCYADDPPMPTPEYCQPPCDPIRLRKCEYQLINGQFIYQRIVS